MLNRVQLIGNLGKDPETKNFPNGGSITTFSIATSDNWTDKQTGERKEHTEWHSIVLQGRLGEIAQQYLRKGSKVYLEGSLRTRKWTDQSNIERYTTEVRCDQMKMLDGNRNQSNDQGGYNQGGNQGGYNQGGNQGGYNQGGNQGASYAKQPQQNQPPQNAPQGGYGNPGYGAPVQDSGDDDLPF